MASLMKALGVLLKNPSWLLVLALSAALGWTSLKLKDSENSYLDLKATTIEATALADRANAKAKEETLKGIVDELNKQTTRANANRLNARSARNAFDSLQRTVEADTKPNSAGTNETCATTCSDRTTTYQKLFLASAREYQDLGERTDRHVNDLITTRNILEKKLELCK